MIPTRDIGTRYNGLATVPRFDLHVPTPDETLDDVRKMLNEVKHFYFDRRYRQCASKCVELLEKRCQDASLHSGDSTQLSLSYDSLARSMHNHSVARIPALQQSEDYYNKALATLPEPLPLQQEEKLPRSPPKLSLSLPAQDEQLKAKPSIPSMWDLNSTFDGFDLSSSASRRHSFNSSKHARTDSLVTDVSWTEDLNSDPFVDDKHAQHDTPDTTYLTAEPPSVKKPSPLQVRKARSSDSLLSHMSVHSDPPAQTPTRSSDGLDACFQFPPPVTPPPKTPHGFVDLLEGTPVQWTTPSQHGGYDDRDDHDHEPTTPTPAAFAPPIQRTHPCPRLLFPRDASSSSLLPLPLNTRIQHYNVDLSSFRGQLVAHLLAIQSLKADPSSQPSSRSVSSTSSAGWSEATATSGGGVDGENRRRSAIMFAPETGHSGRSMTESERVERIRAGRERGWVRERFDPRPCRDLARVALQECEV
ncbi:hypothetical protein GTA08_BOTSDO13276 [Botryosphaeria dothidea]|uniref:Uncharacterized protein n=1 Tax=Botryosphaeria dothidea TaxID=55169 RepID=A0A8H4N4R7_9PEZI|nr:hypothetical protein GTA08_BOTSDO13276 [Botryosphaeria dothidea]